MFSLVLAARHNFLPNVLQSSTQGIPYDYLSIMHFDQKQFSANNRPTFMPKNSKIPFDSPWLWDTPSYYDYLHINLLYCGGEQLMHEIKVTETF